MTNVNYLADDIRQIKHLYDNQNPHAGEFVEQLAVRVERLADQPVEVDASTELTASFGGLGPDQQIRDRALGRAVELAVAEIHLPVTHIGEVLDLAEGFAAWIRTGERPA